MLEEDKLTPMTILFLCFFLIWNTMICLPTLRALSGFFRGECNSYIPALICPHWIIGIALPALFSWDGGLVAVCVGMISVVLPYGVGLCWEVLACRRGERLCCPHNRMLRNLCGGIFGCVGVGGDDGSRQPMEDSEEDEIDLENGIAEGTVGGRGNNGASDGRNGDKVDLNCFSLEERKEYLERSLPFMSSLSHTMCSICLGESNSPSLRSTTDNNNNNNNNTEEEDGITHSYNINCKTHTFHKACIVEWLMKHDDCPICRRTYLVVPPNDYEEEDEVIVEEMEEINNNVVESGDVESGEEQNENNNEEFLSARSTNEEFLSARSTNESMEYVDL